jgi:meso-butanediol dehydrogenase / (S,S)-butanediol dehydrogenase / diacetyl reductase
VKNLKDKVVLITGAASGLGKAMTERFAEEGAIVMVADMDEEAGAAVARSVGGHFILIDVTSPDSVAAAIGACESRAGRLDVVVNNAGVSPPFAALHKHLLQDWHRTIDVNLSGVFYGMKFAIAQFLKQGGGGVVINTASVASLVGIEHASAYAASKSGVLGLTRSAAIEYAPSNIRVNAVGPTATFTPMVDNLIGASADPVAVRKGIENMNPMSGAPTPQDVAAAVAFLASDDARFITGIVLPIDGGYTAK